MSVIHSQAPAIARWFRAHGTVPCESKGRRRVTAPLRSKDAIASVTRVNPLRTPIFRASTQHRGCGGACSKRGLETGCREPSLAAFPQRCPSPPPPEPQPWPHPRWADCHTEAPGGVHRHKAPCQRTARQQRVSSMPVDVKSCAAPPAMHTQHTHARAPCPSPLPPQATGLEASLARASSPPHRCTGTC